MLELGKTPNMDKKSFVLVVNEFWDCVEVVLYCSLGLVLCSVCKKGKMLSFQRKCCQNFVKKPMFLFWL